MFPDPAFDMPFPAYQQRGSFVIPEVPPVVEPDDAPLICLPAINQYWLPFVMGALDQLRNPSSWIVADDDAMYDTLARVSKLREMIGIGVPCVSYEIRFDGGTCQLQQSADGGTTWTEVDGWGDFAACLPPQTQVRMVDTCELQQSGDGGATWDAVPGWDDNFGPCVQDNVPIVGLPPNPNDQSPGQLACSIASYLANQVILEAMSAGVTAITDDLTLLSFANSLLTIIPEFVLVKLGVDAVSILYGAISEGTLSDYEDAIADGSLWLNVSCAIYNAIRTDGMVTPGNFAAIITAVGDISYAHSSVITAIVAYLSSLGPVGLAQLSQRAGLEVGADCTSCGWCYVFDFTIDDGGWSSYAGLSTYTPGVGWTQVPSGTGGVNCDITKDFGSSVEITNYVMDYCTSVFSGGADRSLQLNLAGAGVAFHELSDSAGCAQQGFNPNVTADNATIGMNSNTSATTIVIQKVELQGSGVNPFGSDNC